MAAEPEGLPPAPPITPGESVPSPGVDLGGDGRPGLWQTPPVCCRCSSKLPPRWVLLADGRGCCAGCAKRGEGALQEPT